MNDDSAGTTQLDGEEAFLQHSAFPTTLSSVEVVARFWTELRKLLPADELRVVDPYVLDTGGAEPEIYAHDVVFLLRPALNAAKRVVFIYSKPGADIRELLAQNISREPTHPIVQFLQGKSMHARYLVADRSRALRMEFSFNRIGQSFGTVSLVEDPEDLAAVLNEVERLFSEGAPARGISQSGPQWS